MVQAPVDVVLDLGDGFVGIGGDDPAFGDLLDGQCVGGLLHLDRVVDGVLLFGGQRQRRPEPGVLQRQLGIGVVGDLDLDHPVDIVWVLARGLGTLPHGRDELVLVELLALTGRADETVTRAAGVLGHLRSARGDVDRDTAFGDVVDRGALGLVELAVEVDPVAEPQLTHQPDGLAQTRIPFLELRPVALVTGGDLVECLARSHPEEDAVRVQTAHGREGLRDDRRVVPERRRQHRGPQNEPLGPFAHRRHPRQRERCVTALVPPGLEVIADRGTVHAMRLGGDRQLDEFTRRELLRRRLVPKFEFSHVFLSTPVLIAP